MVVDMVVDMVVEAMDVIWEDKIQDLLHHGTGLEVRKSVTTGIVSLAIVQYE